MSVDRINKVQQWLRNNMQYNMNVIHSNKKMPSDKLVNVRNWILTNIQYNLDVIDRERNKIQKKNTTQCKSSCCKAKKIIPSDELEDTEVYIHVPYTFKN